LGLNHHKDGVIHPTTKNVAIYQITTMKCNL